jgi:hypothetical protein
VCTSQVVSLAVSRWRVRSHRSLKSVVPAHQTGMRSKLCAKRPGSLVGPISMGRMAIHESEVTGISISDRIETWTKTLFPHLYLIAFSHILAYLANSACSSLRDRLA